MGDRFEIRVAGSGGQGVILAAVILGEAAALRTEGLNSVQARLMARKPAAAPPRPKLSSVMSPFTSAVLSARILCW